MVRENNRGDPKILVKNPLPQKKNLKKNMRKKKQ